MRSIELSDQTYKRLLGQIESFNDSPEMVIERLLDLAERQSKSDQLKSEGKLLPEGEYWLPILEILAESGGQRKGSDVISALGARLADRLGSRDYDVLTMGEVRWSNRARFARLRMKEEGLISKASPRGIWEITEKGYSFLSEERGNVKSQRGSS
jgi:hypothetical protein